MLGGLGLDLFAQMTAFCKSAPASAEVGIALAAMGSAPWRDFEGRRVIADFEGPGVLLGSLAPSIGVWADGRSSDGRPVAFWNHLCLVAEGDAPLSGCVLLGRTDVPTGQVRSVTLPFGGSGYVVGSFDGVRIDGRREAVALAPGCALPFFDRLEGAGAAEVLELGPSRSQLVAHLRLDDPRSLEACRWKVKSLSDTEELSSAFGGGTPHRGVVASHMNTAEFEVELRAGTAGVRLRKLFDRFHGRQRARVLANGRPVGLWYVPDEDRRARWAESEFGFDLPEPWAGGTLRLSIDPPPGTPLWSVSELQVFAVAP